MQCLTKHVQQFHKCSQCSQTVNINDPRYLQCQATLENLFPKFTSAAAPENADLSAAEDGDKTISVVMLGGDSTVVQYQPFMTIQNLKTFVQTRLGPVPDKQRLLYKEQELKVGKT